MVPFRSHLAGSSRPRLTRFLIIPLLALICSSNGADLDPLVRTWLERQPELSTWSAAVTQTRNLQALTQPLLSQGHVWFGAPNRFRWQIGAPPATIAIRDANQLVLLYPRLDRAERYVLGKAHPLQDSLALLDAGFPRNEQDLLKRFNLLEQNSNDPLFEIVLEPKNTAAKRLLPKLRVLFSTEDFTLRGTELQFADGSTLRNDFSAIEVNPDLDVSLFEPTIPEGYQITEPQ